MAESKLLIEVRGVQGKDTNKPKNIGSVIATIDNDTNYIEIDSFQGYGETYGRRNESRIGIIKDGTEVFTGTFEELCKKLK